MTERDIQIALYRKRKSASRIMMPNYCPYDWFECDVFQVTNAGYAVEYEIKLTTSDFKADARKRGISWRGDNRTKHDRLAESDVVGPSRFYYVAPPETIALEQADRLDPRCVLPAWAGLVIAKPFVEHPAYVSLKTVCVAPRLHFAKCCERTIRHARGVCYYRYWTAVEWLNERNGREAVDNGK